MKKQMSLVFLLSLSAYAIEPEMNARIESLENRVENIELNQVLNKLNFGGSFFNQYESFYNKRSRTDLFASDPTKQALNDDHDQYLSTFFMRAELNFDLAVTNSLSFFSTLGMSKFWNNDGRQSRSNNEGSSYKSLSGSYSIKDSTARFDVAYLRYHQKSSPWTFALGRMTTNYGPPLNQLDGLARTGTYPAMSYNVILDGVAAVYDFKEIFGEKNYFKLRLFYTPFLYIDQENRSEQISKNNDQVDSQADLINLLGEFTSEVVPHIKRVNIFYSLYTVDGYYEENRQDSSKDGIEYEGTTANTLYLGLEDIAFSGLNLSYTYSQFSVRGSLVEGSAKSYNHLYNINYTFDNTFNAGDILGVEYIQNDDNKVPTDGTTLYVSDFYNQNNGEGYHLFYTLLIDRSQTMRIGYMNYHQRASEFYLNDIESTAQSTYLRWKAFF